MTSVDVVRTVIAEAARRPLADITPSLRLAEDLGLRSLKRVEIAVELEGRLGRPVADAVVMKACTVGDLEASLARTP